MKPSVYIETTIVSYLTARPTRDVIRRSHQLLTKEWWTTHRDRFDLHTSALVLQEASAGDPSAAVERQQALEHIALLPLSVPTIALAERIADELTLPRRARADALHVAIAAVNGISFLLTWNCRHLANAFLADRIEQVCEGHGILAPRIVTPEQLMETP
jgi:hypothetical protein